MISKEKCQRIVDLAVSHGRKRKADGVEVTITGSNIATSRFAINGMTQNQCPDAVRVSVRVIKDGRQARQSTDNYSEKGIRQVVDDALVSASMLERDASLIALPSAKLVREMSKKIGAKPLSRFQRRTALMTAAQRADIIRSVIDLAQAKKLESAGVYASGMSFTALGNSHRVFQYYVESSAEFSVTMDLDGASGWAKAQGIASADFSPLQLAEQANLSRAALSQSARVETRAVHCDPATDGGAGSVVFLERRLQCDEPPGQALQLDGQSGEEGVWRQYHHCRRCLSRPAGRRAVRR